MFDTDTKVFVFVALVLFAVYKYQDPHGLRKYPIVIRSRVASFLRNPSILRLFFADFTRYIDYGYEEYSKNGKTFKIWLNSLQDFVYILPPSDLDVLENVSPQHLSLIDTATQINHIKGTDHELRAQYKFSMTIMKRLANLNVASQVFVMMEEESDVTIEQEVGALTNWTPFEAKDFCVRMVCRINARMLCNKPLCRDEEFLKDFNDYHTQVISKGHFLNWIYIAKPVHKILSRLLFSRQREGLHKAEQQIADVVKQRRKKQMISIYDGEYEETEQNKCNDVVQWALDANFPSEEGSALCIAQRTMSMSVSSVRPTAAALNSLIYYAIECSQYLDPIRREIETVLKDHGGWTEAALEAMVVLDSFIQEALRLCPTGALTMFRTVKYKPFTFPDGRAFPVGTVLAIPTASIHRDLEIYKHPAQFDGLRFHKMNLNDSEPTNKWNAPQTQNTYLPFGHGKQSCPGRFLAQRELKLLFGKLIIAYDMRWTDGRYGRPLSIEMENSLVLDPLRQVDFRSRSREGSGQGI